MLIRFLFYDMWVMIGDLQEWLEKIAPDVALMFATLEIDIKSFMADFKKEGPDKAEAIISSKNIQKVLDFLETMADSIRVKAQVMGSQMAFSMRTFMLSKNASKVIGEKLGWLYGNIIVEVILAVVTFGIGTAIKGGLKAVEWLGKFANWFRKFGKFGRGMAKVIDFFGKGLKWLTTTFQQFAEKLMQLGNKLLEKFKTIFKNLEKKIDDIITKLESKVDDALGNKKKPDVDGSHLDDAAHGRPKTDADGVVDTKHVDSKKKPKGNRDADYLLAVAEAKVMIETQEALGTPAKGAAKLVLGMLKSTYPWVSGMEARFDGPGNYDFYMSASPKQKVKNDFKEDLKKTPSPREGIFPEEKYGIEMEFRETMDQQDNLVKRYLVKDEDDLFQVVENAAGGKLDKLRETKPNWYEGKVDGEKIKIEWQPVGEAHMNEGPHVKIQHWDGAKGKGGKWLAPEKFFIKNKEQFY